MGKTLKIILVFGIFLVIGLFIGRIALTYYYPAEVKRVLPNETLAAAWEAAGEDARAFTQEPVAPYDDRKKGHFFFTELLCVPCAKQVQVTVRYNRSTLEDIRLTKSLSLAPEGESAELRFYLREGKTDGEGNIQAGKILSVSEFRYDSAFMYHYRRLVFDGVTPDFDSYLYLDVYYGEADVETEEPYGSMLIYVPEKETKNVSLTAAEITPAA
ncbi:MAG: hypothetical protein IJR89_04755 [Clostridia bacterium]|nr:hypothetical protein [Clostridia bacterium]